MAFFDMIYPQSYYEIIKDLILKIYIKGEWMYICRKNRYRLMVSLALMSVFMFVLVLTHNHPPHKTRHKNNEHAYLQ